jgi:hypothetical protein
MSCILGGNVMRKERKRPLGESLTGESFKITFGILLACDFETELQDQSKKSKQLVNCGGGEMVRSSVAAV